MAGLLVNGGRVLLVRHEKAGRSYWLLPGGGVEAGEQLEDAVRREFAEECGMSPAGVHGPIAMAETIPPDDLEDGRHILHMIFAVEADACGVEQLVSEDAAVMGHAFVDQKRVHELELRPPIHDYLRGYRPGAAFVSLGRMWVS
ncbi:MAG: NUDIX domain-containing protein [Gaiellales bacterium]